MALPTFFIIGAAKSGTTSLHHYLDRHPEIQMSANKEPNFFAGPENGVPFAPGTIRDLGEYEQLFDERVPVRGEASTDYTTHPRRHGAPERIKASVPDAKLVYLVRDPIARTISHYQMRVAMLGERRSLEQALSDLSDPRSPYVWPSLYASQLDRYLEHFPLRRILVVDQAELRAARRPTLRRIFEFLDVNDAVEHPEFDQELLSNDDWRTYSPAYVRLVDRVVTSPARHIPQPLRRAVRRSLERVLWRPLPEPVLDERSRARLQELYAGEAQRLRALTGQAFSSWEV
jgi:hypothetical protein